VVEQAKSKYTLIPQEELERAVNTRKSARQSRNLKILKVQKRFKLERRF